MKKETAPKENAFVSLLANIVVPALILTKGAKLCARLFGAEPSAALVLVVALAFPTGYFVLDYLRRRELNWISAVGFAGTLLTGSRHNDAFEIRDGKIRTATNRSGGVQGGISNGEEINFRVAFKPTPTVAKAQKTVTTAGEPCEVVGHGRHDPCVLPRAVPIVEAMAALVLADHLLRQRAQRIF